jgi:subtilisin family serine protease
VRRVANLLTVVTVATSASALTLAEADAWTPALQSAGFCVPAPDDPTLVPRAVGALDAPTASTKPIAILDSGVDPATPQLAGRVLQGYDALTGQPVSGDFDGHGTEAAGLAASSGPGMRGTSPASPILPIRIYDPATRQSSPDAIAKGIALAVAKGAGVILISGSGPVSGVGDDNLRRLSTAVDSAFLAGVLTVVGAGDDGVSDATVPASLPHVLVAGASTVTPARSAQSNTGPWVDLLVMGEGVTAPLPLSLCINGYGFSTGTSFAAPALAGVAALVQAQRPTLTTQQLFEVLRRAGTDIGTGGRDDDSGFGVLNTATALSAPPQAKEGSAEIDDDPYWVRGRFAKAHPALLTKTKMRFKLKGSVSPAKDPADVYRVSLIKRERLVVSVSAASPDALLELAILDPRVGDFDVTDNVLDFQRVGTGGLLSDPQLELTATRSGTYYIAVEAAPPVDPDDPTATVADLEPYTISAYKQRKKAKKARARKSAAASRRR